MLNTRTRSALGRPHVPPTKVFRRLAVNKTILKPRVAAATSGQYVYVGFYRRNKIPRCSVYTISEKAIRFRHPDYNPDRAQKLISSSMSRHLSTRNILSKSMHAFLSNRQTDKQTRAKTCNYSFVGGNNKKYGRRVRPTRYAPAVPPACNDTGMAFSFPVLCLNGYTNHQSFFTIG